MVLRGFCYPSAPVNLPDPFNPNLASREALADAVRRGHHPTFLVFPDWGGVPPLGWLSPWIPTPFVDRGLTFISAEHRMMHGKAELFGDRETAEKILRARLPMQARDLGRQVQGFTEATWQEQREAVIFEANLAKFSALPDLKSFLLSTGSAVLVQASPLDKVWGSGLDLADPMLPDPKRWPGMNLVGFSLMRVRERLNQND